MPRLGLMFNALIFSTLLAMPAAAEQQGFRWQHDIESAKALAKQSGRLVLVHFWSPNCGPCLALENTVFNQPGVAGAVETYYVPVKLNAEEHAAIAQQFGVTRIPSDVVLTATGNMVGKMVSPPTPTAYVAELKQVATRMGAKPTPFDNAAAEAPQPAIINDAYAKLDVSEKAKPLAVSPFQGEPGDPYAKSQFLTPPATLANSNPTALTAPNQTAPSSQVAGYTPAAYQQPAAPAQTASVSNVPAATANPYATVPAPDRYATAAPTPQPGRVDNPYAFAAPPLPTVATSEPITKFTQPAATAPPAAAAPPVIATTTAAANAAPVSAPTAPPITPITPIAPEPPQVAANSSGTVATPDGRILPAGAPPLGFEGFSPVAMRKSWKWEPGDPKWGAIHRGRTYWFTSQAEQQEFLANPDYYSPALSGIDPVLAIDHHQAVPGKREHSIDYDNQFYLFSSEASLQQFTSNPERYSSGVRQAMGIRPKQTTVR